MASNDHVPHVSPLYHFRTVAEFSADVEFLLRHFQPVTLAEIVEVLNGDRALSRPSFHLTFDDGFREMYDVVSPILERAGVPATFFVNTAFLDGGGLSHHNALSVLLHHFEAVRSKLGKTSIQRVQSLLSAGNAQCETLRACVLSSRYANKALAKELAATLDVDLQKCISTQR
jgi:hypothetical protein